MPFDPHMSEDVLTWYLKECLLEMMQTFACVSDLPKKLAIGNKIEPLGFQKVKLESGQLGIIGFKHLVLPSGIRKCCFNMCYCM